MIVLGFDTATSATSVGLRLADGRTLAAHDAPRPGEHPGHATRLLAMASDLLAGASLGWSSLDRIAVGVGPGLFTGLRVGVATARGLAQALSVELAAISSLRALVAAAAEHGHSRLLAVIDARRGEAFAAAFAADGAAAIRELVPARALAPAELALLAARAAQADGLDGTRWLAIGDGAIRFRGHLEGAGVAVPPDSSPLHVVDAVAICALAATAPPSSRYEDVLPDYLRRPDAEVTVKRAAAPEGVAR
jgi:tRNA threonylcarbamoyladenosine biosynthesis protein TsaB